MLQCYSANTGAGHVRTRARTHMHSLTINNELQFSTDVPGGALALPQRPGLGVEIDMDALYEFERYAYEAHQALNGETAPSFLVLLHMIAWCMCRLRRTLLARLNPPPFTVLISLCAYNKHTYVA